MRVRRNALVGAVVVAYVVVSVVFLIMNDGQHLTDEQLFGWLR